MPVETDPGHQVEFILNFRERAVNPPTGVGGVRRFLVVNHDSIQYPQRVKLEGSTIYLPKVGWVDAIVHRQIIGKIKTVTVKKTGLGQTRDTRAPAIEAGSPSRK